MPSARRTPVAIAIAALVAPLVVACTDDSSPRLSVNDGPTRTTVPAVCRPSPDSTSTTLPSGRCAEALFLARVDADGSAALKKVEADQQLGFGRGLCAYAQALASANAAAPTYQELAASNAASWKVSPPVVDEIVGFSEVLCPEAMSAITTLREQTDILVFTMKVAGQGSAAVVITAPNGSRINQDIIAPWSQNIESWVPYAIRIEVQPKDEAVTSCALEIAGEEIGSSERDEGGSSFSCSATVEEIRKVLRAGS